jgi:hypothetical protein
MGHLDQARALGYVLEQVSEEERLEADTHLAECGECVDRVRALSHLRASLDPLWAVWTAPEHGRAYRRWLMAQALGEAAKASPSIAAQARQWVQQLEKEAELALVVFLSRASRIASVAEAVLPSGFGFRLRPAVAGVGSATQTDQLQQHLAEGSRLLAQDRPEEAIRELSQAVRIDARAPQAAISEVYCNDRLVLQVVVDSRRGRVSAKYWPDVKEGSPALALLMPRESKGKALVAAFEPVEGETYLLAEFLEPPEGLFTVQISPATP